MGKRAMLVRKEWSFLVATSLGYIAFAAISLLCAHVARKKMKAKRKGDDDTTHTASTSCNVGCLLFYVVLGLILLDHMCSSSCSREAAETALTSSSVVCSSAHLFQ